MPSEIMAEIMAEICRMKSAMANFTFTLDKINFLVYQVLYDG